MHTSLKSHFAPVSRKMAASILMAVLFIPMWSITEYLKQTKIKLINVAQWISKYIFNKIIISVYTECKVFCSTLQMAEQGTFWN